MLRAASIGFFIFVFTTGAICAAVCPETILDARHEVGRDACTDCISPHFLVTAKPSDPPPADFHVAVDPAPMVEAGSHPPERAPLYRSSAADLNLLLLSRPVLRI